MGLPEGREGSGCREALSTSSPRCRDGAGREGAGRGAEGTLGAAKERAVQAVRDHKG